MSKLKVMTTLAVEVAFKRAVLPAWLENNGDIDLVWEPTNALMERIRTGERGDVVIVIDRPMLELADKGIVRRETIKPIAQARFGIGVRQGAPRPDISTPDAFIDAVRTAGPIAYSLSGASGQYFLQVLEKFGIADEVLARAVSIPSGFTGEKVLSGEANMAVQQVSELMSVDGIDVVGAFPDALQQPTDFSAAIFAQSDNLEEASRFLTHLTSEAAGDAYATGGLTSRVGQSFEQRSATNG